MLRLTAVLFTVVVLNGACHAQGWFKKATGVSTPTQIRKIAPNGISYRPKATTGYENYYKNMSDLNRNQSTSKAKANSFHTKLGTGPAKTKSYLPPKPKNLGTFDVGAARAAAAQHNNNTAQIWNNAFSNIGQMVQQSQARQQYQQAQTYQQPQQHYVQPQQYAQPQQHYVQPQQQYAQPQQHYVQPHQHYVQPPQQQYAQPVQQHQSWTQPTYQWQGN